jgi:hypothetical protein
MPYLTNIVDEINATMVASGSVLDQAKFIKKFNGIAKSVPLISEEGQKRLPILYSIADGTQFAGIDDRYNLFGYYRIVSRAITTSDNNFGDSNRMKIETTNLNLICYADLDRTRKNEFEISDLVSYAIPTILPTSFTSTLTGVQSVEIDATEINDDSIAVWNNEYSGYDYQLSTSQYLFAITIQVVVHYDSNCATNCDECN